MKMVSVIVPVHNAAGTLEAAVRSALSQTYAEIELILVDDGAEDGSGDLCDAFAAADGRVRAFHMEDRGVSAARNLGIEEARGGLITFLDADDCLHPGMVQMLAEMLDVTGADCAGCGFERRSGDARPFAGACDAQAGRGTGPDSAAEAPAGASSAGIGTGELRELRGAQIISEGILRPDHPDTRIWSKLFRREFIGQKRFREGLSIGEDFLFLAELAGEDTRYVSTQRELYSYYINPNGAMERPFAPNHMDHLRCWELAEEEIRGTFPDLLTDPDTAARLAAQHLIAAVLTASKIARLPAGQQTQYVREFETCRAAIGKYNKIKGAAPYLPRGYRVKIQMLLHTPGLYRKLYH